ncbi:MAG: aspartate-semialdehyde dehydrogenase [Fimbriimonadaceae bacterium]
MAILGATGAVGGEFLRLFEQRRFPVSSLRLLASERSAGKRLVFQGKEVAVEAVGPRSFEGVEYAFFSAGASRSREFAPFAIDAGATVIDNSSAFRMDADVPLVIPEINGQAMTAESKLVAVPNCSAIVLLMAVAPLRSLGRFERIIVSTYQSASGGGAAMMQRLVDETRDALDPNTQHPTPTNLPPYAFNLFSHNTPINEHGYNEEEWKVIHESRKILGMPELKINVTCIRVPVLRAHSESITVEFGTPLSTMPVRGEGAGGGEAIEDAVRRVLSEARGVRVVDDRPGNNFPTPLEASGQEDVLVGRIRRDVSHPSAISLFASGDQLLKGAALNAVQIAEELIKMRSAVSVG